MTSKETRKAFLDFFKTKGHEIVSSAPMVVKNDPTLMFTNAGMNQFKDLFLGNSPIKYPRIANTQKCLRVSGKHNDLEEVGIDTYHHTMFEMLGNWSFGDYFKKDAIAWAWELLTEVYKLPKDRLYVTVFEGDQKENLAFDQEAFDCWKELIATDRILKGNKKDNFWEMGDTGPCGPCTEIHIDLRSEEERQKVDGKTLVNESHPQVIEIWNNVFMEFNRMADGSLNKLPAQHVDTGMGFERLCMALQGKQSNYDTDVFQPLIQAIATAASKKYKDNEKTDIAMRVMADHIRAIAFAIADGQLPSNNKAGYVIRRILRRAVRYGYTFLNFKEPFLNKLVPVLADQFDGVFPELKSQQDFVQKVILEEEASFLRTLSTGIQRFESFMNNNTGDAKIPGSFAFELYDTFGFPIDLTELIAREQGREVDMEGFAKSMEEQKSRSRQATVVETTDWTMVHGDLEVEFVGYDSLEAKASIVKYRNIASKGKVHYQIVFNKTPFYAESGGQVGDTGVMEAGGEQIEIRDTKKENNLIIHLTDKLPSNLSGVFEIKVDVKKRSSIENNHSATHLIHAALKQVLGTHVNQKGSLVNAENLRFDFSHFAKITEEELKQIETIVNTKIRENIALEERRNVPLQEARDLGAMALFGEKYGEYVRVITFDPAFSRELCGGTHVKSTGQIRLCKILSESAVAAGVRRIEAITAERADAFFEQERSTLHAVSGLLGNPKDILKGIQSLLDENSSLKRKIQALQNEKVVVLKSELLAKAENLQGINFVAEMINLDAPEAIKNLAFELRSALNNSFIVLGAEIEGKAHLTVILSDNLVSEKNMNASTIVRELGKEIQGGGGGQVFYATAGGTNPKGLKNALKKAKEQIVEAFHGMP
jgi:alanyl-tRNA synthetase